MTEIKSENRSEIKTNLQFKKFNCIKKIIIALITLIITLIVIFVNYPNLQSVVKNMFGLNSENGEKKSVAKTGKDKTLSFDILEIANNSEKIEAGLMNRSLLCENCGMLFVFKGEQNLNFWMKNTFIPLDIIFMDSNFVINTIHTNTKTNQILETYPAASKSKYALEVNAFYSTKKGLSVGDKLTIVEEKN